MATRITIKRNTKISLFQPNFQADSSPLCRDGHGVAKEVVNVVLSPPLLHRVHAECLGVQDSVNNICSALKLIELPFLKKLNLITGKKQYFYSFLSPSCV